MADESTPLTNRGVQVTPGWDLDTISTRNRPYPGVGYASGLQTDVWMRPQRVVAEGPESPTDFLELLLDTDKHGNNTVLRVYRATANWFKWTDHYPRYIPGLRVDADAGVVRLMGPNLKERRGWNRRPFQISRSPRRSGNPAGLTHGFRLKGPMTNRVLAHLAAHTEGTWYWMTAPNGARRTREEWLEVHEVMSGSREERLPPGGEGLAS